MMKTNYYFSLFLILFSSTSWGQNNTHSALIQDYVQIDMSDFNQHIQGKYPTLNNFLYQFQAAYYSRGKRGQVGIGLSSMFVLSNSDSQKQTEFNGFGLSLLWQYHVVNKKSFKLFVEIEPAYRKYTLTLGQTKHGVSIEDVLNFPVDNYKFTNTGYYSKLGLGALKYFDIFNYNLGLGISGGYRFDGGEWKYEGINPVYNEISKLSGYYMSVNVSAYLDPQKNDDKGGE